MATRDAIARAQEVAQREFSERLANVEAMLQHALELLEAMATDAGTSESKADKGAGANKAKRG